MNNLLKFIGKNGNFLVFIILEVVAFMLIVNFNSYPHSKFLSTSNAIAGWQNEQITNIRYFFALRSINDELAEENARLRAFGEATGDRLLAIGEEPYSPTPLPPYTPISAKVIGLTLFENHNYLTINKGAADSIRVGQGVRNAQGVVGIICTVNRHYSIILPVINTESNISCRFLKNDYLGSLVWDGKNPDYASLEDVAAHISVLEGDTLVTSGLTASFPEGIPVGVIEKVQLQKGDSYYTLRVKLATDFRKIKYVEVLSDINEDINENIIDELD